MNGDRYSKGFTAWIQFLTCLYAQIIGKDSLREIEQGCSWTPGAYIISGWGRCPGPRCPTRWTSGCRPYSRLHHEIRNRSDVRQTDVYAFQWLIRTTNEHECTRMFVMSPQNTQIFNHKTHKTNKNASPPGRRHPEDSMMKQNVDRVWCKRLRRLRRLFKWHESAWSTILFIKDVDRLYSNL